MHKGFLDPSRVGQERSEIELRVEKCRPQLHGARKRRNRVVGTLFAHRGDAHVEPRVAGAAALHRGRILARGALAVADAVIIGAEVIVRDGGIGIESERLTQECFGVLPHERLQRRKICENHDKNNHHDLPCPRGSAPEAMEHHGGCEEDADGRQIHVTVGCEIQSSHHVLTFRRGEETRSKEKEEPYPTEGECGESFAEHPGGNTQGNNDDQRNQEIHPAQGGFADEGIDHGIAGGPDQVPQREQHGLHADEDFGCHRLRPACFTEDRDDPEDHAEREERQRGDHRILRDFFRSVPICEHENQWKWNDAHLRKQSAQEADETPHEPFAALHISPSKKRTKGEQKEKRRQKIFTRTRPGDGFHIDRMHGEEQCGEESDGLLATEE